MALKIKKVSGKGKLSAADILAKHQNTVGESIGSFGGALLSSDRVPTGLFPLDLAMGGGFPRGKMSIVFGPESSNKTNIVLKAIAMHQLLWPEKINVFVDVEHSFDPDWAQKLGVDTDKLIVISPGFAEQVVDIVADFLDASDTGVVALDSIAAMMTTAEGEATAERANVGGASLPINKLYRKTVKCLADAEKDGRYPTLLCINQVRQKVGVLFGDPETQPGGKAMQFQSSMTVRVYGKNILDSAVSTVMPVRKEVNFVIKKWKAPILNVQGKFEMVTIPHDGFKIGDCDDFNTLKAYLQSFEMFDKAEKGKGWVIFGQTYAKIDDFRERLVAEPELAAKVRQEIVKRQLVHTNMLEDKQKPTEAQKTAPYASDEEFDPETGEIK